VTARSLPGKDAAAQLRAAATQVLAELAAAIDPAKDVDGASRCRWAGW
jgi:hypothetical protein